MALKSIEAEWEGFAAMVFRGMTPSETQIAEMRKAFYAGAWAMICAAREIGGRGVTVDEGVAYMEARQQEGEAFYKQLVKEHVEKN